MALEEPGAGDKMNQAPGRTPVLAHERGHSPLDWRLQRGLSSRLTDLSWRLKGSALKLTGGADGNLAGAGGLRLGQA
jgi:hypothetical protein